MKFRTKTRYFEAEQYTDPASVHRIIDMAGSSKGICNSEDGLFIHKANASLRARKTDWIVKVQGELYLCCHEIFRQLIVDWRKEKRDCRGR